MRNGQLSVRSSEEIKCADDVFDAGYGRNVPGVNPDDCFERLNSGHLNVRQSRHTGRTTTIKCMQRQLYAGELLPQGHQATRRTQKDDVKSVLNGTAPVSVSRKRQLSRSNRSSDTNPLTTLTPIQSFEVSDC